MGRRTPALFPALLKHWRHRRGMSQLDLALAADVSSRHVSFLETGRARPSRAMVLRLCGTLDVPLRERNALLRAAGLEEAYPDAGTEDGVPPVVARALAWMEARQEPYPLLVFDRRYDLRRTNGAAARLLGRFVADASILASRPNLLELVFDPRGARPFIADWAEVARDVLGRLQREVLAATDPELEALLARLLAFPGVPADWREPDLAVPVEPVLAFRLVRDDLSLAFFTTVTRFSAPQNVLVEDLRVESWFPLDDATAEACARLAAAG